MLQHMLVRLFPHQSTKYLLLEIASAVAFVQWSVHVLLVVLVEVWQFEVVVVVVVWHGSVIVDSDCEAVAPSGDTVSAVSEELSPDVVVP